MNGTTRSQSMPSPATPSVAPRLVSNQRAIAVTARRAAFAPRDGGDVGSAGVSVTMATILPTRGERAVKPWPAADAAYSIRASTRTLVRTELATKQALCARSCRRWYSSSAGTLPAAEADARTQQRCRDGGAAFGVLAQFRLGIVDVALDHVAAVGRHREEGQHVAG